MPDGWRKIEPGLFESADGRYRIANPWRLTTSLRHRWLVAERRASGSAGVAHARRRLRHAQRSGRRIEEAQVFGLDRS